MCQIELIPSGLTIISFREMWAPLEVSVWLIFCSFLLSFSWAKISRFQFLRLIILAFAELCVWWKRLRTFVILKVVQQRSYAVEFFFFFSICAALANSFSENMSVAVLAGDHFAEVLGASLQLGCCVVGCDSTMGARKNRCFNSVLETEVSESEECPWLIVSSWWHRFLLESSRSYEVNLFSRNFGC